MNWAFVDYENVGSLENLDIQKYDRIFIFCGPKIKESNLVNFRPTVFVWLSLSV